MRLSPLTIIISSLLVTACGGSGDSNTPPMISSAIGITDSSANGTIETSEPERSPRKYQILAT